MNRSHLQHDARHRLAGYLLARGFRDDAQRDAVLGALEADIKAEGIDSPASPQHVVHAITRFDAWYDDLLARIAPPEQHLTVRLWLEQNLASLLRQHADAFAHPVALAAAARAAMAQTPAFPPPLPHAHPQDMPRQPLGDLPAVLRGAYWVSTARWSWPQRLRRAHSRDTKLVSGDDLPHS